MVSPVKTAAAAAGSEHGQHGLGQHGHGQHGHGHGHGQHGSDAAEPRGVTLEWELSLDSSELRSHGWFHGRLGRLEAEELLSSDGDFLVRESTSQPGEFAITCRWNGNNIHFMINKVRVKPDTIYESEQFFLEDEPYETIPHLVTGYVGVERAVSAASGARLRRPVNRTAAIGGGHTPPVARTGSWRASLLARGAGRRTGSAEQLSAGPPRLASSGSLPRLSEAAELYQKPGRLRTDPLPSAPPPKPDRPRDSSSTPTPPPPGVARIALAPVDPEPPSAFDVAGFETLLLPVTHNAPLDKTALRAVTLRLLETDPSRLAAALTARDIELLLGDGTDRGLGVTCGVELLTLPQGHQLRQDLLERSEWFCAFVIASIVSLEDDDQRVRVINKWIQVAVDTKTALGNLYGFANIIQALCSTQVQRLYVSWHQVRQRFTRSAVQFDAELAPCVRRSTIDATVEAPNTCVPHVAPLAALLEEDLCAELADAEKLQTALHLLEEGRRMSAETATYRRNARTVLAGRPGGGTEQDDGTRDDLFRTEFHLKLLVGSGAAAAEQDQRRRELLPRVHRVLTMLAEQRDPSPT